MYACLCLGFFLGAATVLVVQGLGFLYMIKVLSKKGKQIESKLSESGAGVRGDIDIQQSLDSIYSKQGIVWVLDAGKVRSHLADALQKEQKRKKDILDVSPARHHAKIKDRLLILTDKDGCQTIIQLRGCMITAVSATGLSSRKWAKRYPIKMESKTSVIYKGSKTLYLYFETSWEKESWCKALHVASSEEKEKWSVKLCLEFQSYMTSVSSEYPSFAKPSACTSMETVDRDNKLDGSSSKVRLLWKKLSRKAYKVGEDKSNLMSSSGCEERKISEKSHSVHDPVSGSTTAKAYQLGKTSINSMEENMGFPPAPSFSNSGVSVNSDTDDKFYFDEGTLCWNLLITRLFFDARSNKGIMRSVQARIQRTLSNLRIPSYIGEVICTNFNFGKLPPYIHAMRVLPADTTEVCSLEIDVEYTGGAVLDVETRLEVHEGLEETNPEPGSVGEVASDLLEEYFGGKLSYSEGTGDGHGKEDKGDPGQDNLQNSRSTLPTSTSVSRWKSMLNTVAKQVSQVSISLQIRVASLRGTMRLYVKPPPSDQLWFGFTSMPDVDFCLESSVGEHKITNARIALFIINRFKAAIGDTLVLPNCESVCLPWMLAEKNDWAPRKVAPFIWINQEAVSDPSTVNDVPASQSGESSARTSSPDPPGDNADKSKNEEHFQQETYKSSNQSVFPASKKPLALKSTSLQELRTPLLINDRPRDDRDCLSHVGEDGEDCLSPTRSVSLNEEHHHAGDDGGGRLKKMGRRARMLDLGKKMGEKLEEKRRHLEVKGRHIVENLRNQAS